MKLLILLVLALSPASPPVARDTLRSCPAPQERADSRIRAVLNGPFIAEIRARFDLGTASPDSIQLLTNVGDRQRCSAMWEVIDRERIPISPGDLMSFHRSGDRLFVVYRERPPPPGTIRIDGRSFVMVVDDRLRVIGRFMA
jgi:hypothetical protein